MSAIHESLNQMASRVIPGPEDGRRICECTATLSELSGIACDSCGTKTKRVPRYRCAESGKAVPGVTTIIGDMVAKPGLIPWSARLAVEHLEAVCATGDLPTQDDYAAAKRAHAEKRDEGASIGTMVHDALNAWLAGGILDGYLPDDPQAAEAVRAGLAWLDERKRDVIAVEAVIVGGNVEPSYAGRVDLVYMDEDGEGLVVADWKSTKSGLYAESLMQIAAYADAIQTATGIVVTRTELVHVDRESGRPSTLTQEYDAWRCAAEDFGLLVEARSGHKQREKTVSKWRKAWREAQQELAS